MPGDEMINVPLTDTGVPTLPSREPDPWSDYFPTTYIPCHLPPPLPPPETFLDLDAAIRYGGHERHGLTPQLAAARPKHKQVSREQAAIRAEYERNLEWLLTLIEYAPGRIRHALGCTCRRGGYG
jgi:hypothetical protein